LLDRGFISANAFLALTVMAVITTLLASGCSLRFILVG
jgi:hypothetical protein